MIALAFFTVLFGFMVARRHERKRNRAELASILRGVLRLIADRKGIAAIEFALLLPIAFAMLVGTIEISSGVAVQRKVSMAASSLSQMIKSNDLLAPSDFAIRYLPSVRAIALPYAMENMSVTATEVYISSLGDARIIWSAGDAPRGNPGDTITLSDFIAAPQTYVMITDASFFYAPALGIFVSPVGITLTDSATTRITSPSGCIGFPDKPGGLDVCATP